MKLKKNLLVFILISTILSFPSIALLNPKDVGQAQAIFEPGGINKVDNIQFADTTKKWKVGDTIFLSDLKAYITFESGSMFEDGEYVLGTTCVNYVFSFESIPYKGYGIARTVEEATNTYELKSREGTVDIYYYSSGNPAIEGHASYAYVLPEPLAEDIAKEFNDNIDSSCNEGINPKLVGDDSVSSAWANASEQYSKLSDEEKAKFKGEGIEKPSGEIGEMLDKYDFIYERYGNNTEMNLDNFLKRNVTPSEARKNMFSVTNIDNSTWIIVTISLIGLTAVCFFVFYRRRKEN